MHVSRALLYIIKSTRSADSVTCQVPWEVDDQEVFFGPCKKRLRENLAQILAGRNETYIDERLFLVGFNPANRQRQRNVLWAGRAVRLMTFAAAYRKLTGPRYREMRSHANSPLHVKPLYEDGKMVGYEHRNSLHKENNDWTLDLEAARRTPGVYLEGNRLMLQRGVSPQEAFRRDACALCENICFARGRGCAITVDAEAVDILQRAQPLERVDDYAIFGYRQDNSADGLTGSYLPLSGKCADKFIQWIQRRASQLGPSTVKGKSTRASVRC